MVTIASASSMCSINLAASVFVSCSPRLICRTEVLFSIALKRPLYYHPVGVIKLGGECPASCMNMLSQTALDRRLLISVLQHRRHSKQEHTQVSRGRPSLGPRAPSPTMSAKREQPVETRMSWIGALRARAPAVPVNKRLCLYEIHLVIALDDESEAAKRVVYKS